MNFQSLRFTLSGFQQCKQVFLVMWDLRADLVQPFKKPLYETKTRQSKGQRLITLVENSYHSDRPVTDLRS